MSAEHPKQVRDHFVTAYSRLLADTRGSWLKKPSGEAHLHTMKVEFDAALALVSDTAAETDWVRSVLAEHGYSGPLTETSCPLREWMAPKETQPVTVPATVVEYRFDTEDGGRQVFFGRAQAASKMDALIDRGEKGTFSSEEFLFSANWDAACGMLRHGQGLSPLQVHVLKLGLAAGMTPNL